jgi:hypothetical protein
MDRKWSIFTVLARTLKLFNPDYRVFLKESPTVDDSYVPTQERLANMQNELDEIRKVIEATTTN